MECGLLRSLFEGDLRTRLSFTTYLSVIAALAGELGKPFEKNEPYLTVNPTKEAHSFHGSH